MLLHYYTDVDAPLLQFLATPLDCSLEKRQKTSIALGFATGGRRPSDIWVPNLRWETMSTRPRTVLSFLSRVADAIPLRSASMPTVGR